MNLEGLLAHTPLFQGLDSDEIARLAHGSRALTAARGDTLFHKGDTPTGFFLIIFGLVKLALNSPQGDEKVVAILGPGDTFGEAVMFIDQPFLVDAQALVQSRLVHVSKGAILQELDRDPRLVRKMIAALSMRLHHLIDDVEGYSLRSGCQRIVDYLLRNAVEEDGRAVTVTLPTNKRVIASRLNLTQETFSRILQTLGKQGLLSVERRRIHIPDIERLQAVAGID